MSTSEASELGLDLGRANSGRSCSELSAREDEVVESERRGIEATR